MSVTGILWRTCLALLFWSLGNTIALAQQPVIRAADKVAGKTGELVTLQGTFNNDATRVAVSFGAVRGAVQFVSDRLLEVKVPSGTTYENMIVTDLNSGLSDHTSFPFFLSYGGDHGITTSTLQGQLDFDSESGLYDLCMCDFDNDGRTDVATANDGANSISLLANTTSGPGLANISFNRIPFLIGTRSIHAKCGDLNGDGKPDLIVSEGGANGDRLFVFRNTSAAAGSFTFSIQSIRLTGKKVKRIDIADLDDNGKPDVIVTNQTANDISILVNQSTPGAIAFAATPLTFTVGGADSTDGLAVEDLDGDGLPEIVTSQFLTQASNIFILRNTSVPGNMSFTADQTLTLGNTVVNLKVGDLDGDGKAEIVATQLIGSGTVSIFRNQSSGALSFAAPVSFATDARPWGIDFGDIDGDGKPDIVVASLERSVTVLNNESTSSGLAFSPLIRITQYINRHVAVGDVDADGKPDVVFASVDDNNTNILASKVSVFRNSNCLVPVVEPAGPMTICAGFPLQLTTTPSTGTTYEWKDGSTTVASGPDAFFDVTATGAYAVTATSESGTCVRTSNTVSITVDPGTTTGTATPVNDGPVCPGGTLSLSVNDVGGTEYRWTGPDGYTGTGLNPAPITNFQAANAGRYFLDVVVNGCVAQQASTVVEVISVPEFRVGYTGDDLVCTPDTKTLTLVPNDPDFSYQWAERSTGNIAGATGTTFSATSSGEYYVKAQYLPDPSCPALESSGVVLTFVTAPAADFSAPSAACTGQSVPFTDQSTGDASQTRSYQWSFGDAQTSTDQSPAHSYATPNTYNVTLQVSYDNGACLTQTTKQITIQSAPPLSITSSSGSFLLCRGDTLELGVNGTFDAYLWSTGEITPSIAITSAGSYSVDVTSGSCIVTDIVTVDSLATPALTATADPEEVTGGLPSQLTATSGLAAYLWDPAATLSDPALANPIATPSETTVYTVRGTDSNGCTGMATVEVRVKGDLIVNKLVPTKLISPENGDSINDVWVVGNILDYPQCAVAIYDDKGVKVYEAKPYNNDWQGTYNGRQLPDGVYYYVIRCDGEEDTPRTGSITVLR